MGRIIKYLILVSLLVSVLSHITEANDLTPNELRQKMGVVKVYNKAVDGEEYSMDVLADGSIKANATQSGTWDVEINDGTDTLEVNVDGSINSNVTISSPLSANQMADSVSVALATDHYDEITRAINTIDYSHHEIHSGSHYYIEGFVDLAADAELTVSLVTPNTTKWAHFEWEIESSGILTTYFYENCVSTAGGTSVTPLNNNRNSSNTSGLTIASGATVDRTGTIVLSQKKVGGTGFKEVKGGSASRDAEIILKQDTIYCRVFRSGSADNVIAFRATWYEHSNKSN